MYLESCEHGVVHSDFTVEVIIRIIGFPCPKPLVGGFVHRFPRGLEQVLLDVGHGMEIFAVYVLQGFLQYLFIERE